MNSPASRSFNSVAGGLVEKERRALVESIRAGRGELFDATSGERWSVVPDRPAEMGEQLFYVGFLGSKRDAIPTQHYLVPSMDARMAVARAHELYELRSRRRKGAALRVLLGKPPAARTSP